LPYYIKNKAICKDIYCRKFIALSAVNLLPYQRKFIALSAVNLLPYQRKFIALWFR